MEKYINRSIEKKIIEASDEYPVVMIIGPRQVGKTTLLEHIREIVNTNIKRVSFDDLSIRELAINDPELFLKTYPAPLIIDEFQYAPELLSYIKIIVD
ncbi:MAG: AAA family ATPase, partial [Anaerovoracaceae bacterium]